MRWFQVILVSDPAHTSFLHQENRPHAHQFSQNPWMVGIYILAMNSDQPVRLYRYTVLMFIRIETTFHQMRHIKHLYD